MTDFPMYRIVGGIRDKACRIEAMIELFQNKLPTFGEKQQYISSQLERLKAKLSLPVTRLGIWTCARTLSRSFLEEYPRTD